MIRCKNKNQKLQIYFYIFHCNVFVKNKRRIELRGISMAEERAEKGARNKKMTEKEKYREYGIDLKFFPFNIFRKKSYRFLAMLWG